MRLASLSARKPAWDMAKRAGAKIFLLAFKEKIEINSMESADAKFFEISPGIAIPLSEIAFNAIRAQGPGGQNVNKVSCAIHLRFDIVASSLPLEYQQRLLACPDQRISNAGVLVIKAQSSRSLEKNKAEALQRLREIILQASFVPVLRKATKPTRGSQLRRLESKLKRGVHKAMRGRVNEH
jgi:ribosome-associated protein